MSVNAAWDKNILLFKSYSSSYPLVFLLFPGKSSILVVREHPEYAFKVS